MITKSFKQFECNVTATSLHKLILTNQPHIYQVIHENIPVDLLAVCLWNRHQSEPNLQQMLNS